LFYVKVHIFAQNNRDMKELERHLMEAIAHLDGAAYAAEQMRDTLLSEALLEIMNEVSDIKDHL